MTLFYHFEHTSSWTDSKLLKGALQFGLDKLRAVRPYEGITTQKLSMVYFKLQMQIYGFQCA